VSCRGREIGPGVKGLAVGSEEDAHGPATLPRQRLGGLHVDGVDIRAFLAVNLDRDEVLVDHGSSQLVLEGLVRHHVAPMACSVSNREKDGNLPFDGRSKSVVRPGPPVHWVVGVLQEVWAGRRSEVVAASHPSTLCAATSRECSGRASAWRARRPL